MHVDEATFEPVGQSAKAARDFVRDCLASNDLGDSDPELAVLLVSELATNAIVHAGHTFVVWVICSPPCVRVGVDDPSPELPVLGHPGADDISGRGLAMIGALADRWGVEAGPVGKRTWFEICG
jgi:hypothetical protein